MPKPKIDLTEQPVSAAIAITNGILKNLDLADIELDPITDVRTGPPDKDEPKEIDQLARSMYEDGQIEPIVVRPKPDAPGKYLLIAGRRRLSGGKLIEEQLTAKWPIQAMVVERDDEQAWSAAVQENVKRKNFSDIQFARICIAARDRRGWTTDPAWTKHVAEYLHVSRTTVSQKVKLLELPDKVQAKVHSGAMAADAAFVYAKTLEGNREEVLGDAQVLAEEEAKAKRAKTPSGSVKASKDQKAAAKGPQPAAASKAGAKEPPAKVQKKHILAAARKHDALSVDKPRTRGEILELFTELTGPSFPAPMVAFAETFLDKWVTGQLKRNDSLIAKWHAVAELVEKGMKKGASGKKAA